MHNYAFNRSTNHAPKWLDNFVSNYQIITIDNLDLLSTIYHEDVVFIDPMHRVEGINNLLTYFEHLYLNLSTCNFIIQHVISLDDEAAVYWQMTYQHPKLNSGKLVVVDGHSHVKAEQGKVIYHRDYLDLGAMLYEQLPLFGKLTKWIKTKAAK